MKVGKKILGVLKHYNCEYCHKSFTQASSLKNHIHTIHDGHKDHKCESCSKSFSHPGNLKQHIRTIHKGHKDVNLVENHLLKEEL